MARDKTNGEKPAKSQAGEGEPQAASIGAIELQAADHGNKPSTGGLPISDAIKVFATDKDKESAKKYKYECKRIRNEIEKNHNDELNQVILAIKRLNGDDLLYKKVIWFDRESGKQWLLRHYENADQISKDGIVAWKSENPDRNYENWFERSSHHKTDAEREKEIELIKRKDDLNAEYSRRWLQEQKDIEDEYDKQNSILAASLLAKLRSSQRIAVGRVNDAEQWTVIPATEWNDEWTFFDRSNHAGRDSPRTTIKDIRIFRPEDLTTNDRTAGRKPLPQWPIFMAEWLKIIAEKGQLPGSKKEAYQWFGDAAKNAGWDEKKNPIPKSEAFREHIKRTFGDEFWQSLGGAKNEQV